MKQTLFHTHFSMKTTGQILTLIFVLCSLGLSNSYANNKTEKNWNLKDSYKNELISEHHIRAQDSNYFAIANKTICIEGNIHSAFKELTILSSNDIVFKKDKIKNNTILLSATGAICSLNPPFPHELDVCYNQKVITQTLSIKSCNVHQKYLSKYQSPVVTLKERILIKSQKNLKSDIFYTQKLQVTQTPSEAILQIDFLSWAYGLQKPIVEKNKTILIKASADAILNAQENHEIPTETLTSDFGSNLQCVLIKKEISPVLTCKSNLFSFKNLRLPKWTLEQISAQTDFDQKNEFLVGFSIFSNGKTLRQGIDFHSLSEMYEHLYSKNQVQGCIEDTVANLRFLKEEIRECGYTCASQSLHPAGFSVDSIQLDIEKGIVIKRNQHSCTLNDIYGSCDFKEVISQDEIQIPFCGI